MRLASLVALLLTAALLLPAPRSTGAAAPQRAAGVRASVSFSSDAVPGGGGDASGGVASAAPAPSRWANITLQPPFGPPPRGYEPPQWAREAPPSRRVTLRGWLAAGSEAAAGAPVFALPRVAWPARDEAFAANFKGRDRRLRLSADDGVARLLGDVEAGAWMPLVSFSFEAGTEHPAGDDGAARALRQRGVDAAADAAPPPAARAADEL